MVQSELGGRGRRPDLRLDGAAVALEAVHGGRHALGHLRQLVADLGWHTGKTVWMSHLLAVQRQRRAVAVASESAKVGSVVQCSGVLSLRAEAC